MAKINAMAATVEWLNDYIAAREAKGHGFGVRDLPRDIKTARTEYLRDKLDLYTRGIYVTARRVTFVVSTLSPEEIRSLLRIKIQLEEGEAVFAGLDAEELWEPYSDVASQVIEVTFQVP